MALSDIHICSWIGGPNQSLRILTADAATPTVWSLQSSSYTPPYNTCANPQTLQHPNQPNLFILGHSNANEAASWANAEAAIITLATSSDGLNFSVLGNLDFTSTYKAVFGFCWFVARSGRISLIFPASPAGGPAGNSGSFQMYEMHPLDQNNVSSWASLSGWSSPVLFTGTSLPSSYQDPCIVDDSLNGNYYMLYGAGGPKILKCASSATDIPTSGWQPMPNYGDPFGLSGQTGANAGDGPTAKIFNSKWYFFWEVVDGHGVYSMHANVGASDWRTGSGDPTFTPLAEVTSPAHERTGSIFTLAPITVNGRFLLTRGS